MTELTLQELKDIELEILKTFDSFCKKNNIRYFLAFGTLLGAVRYKKFIPWDDDIDVLVPREDYNRLISLFEDNEQYKLFCFEKNSKFLFPFAKLCDMQTRKIETAYKPLRVELGVEIDIFPLDSFSDDFDVAKEETARIIKEMKWLARTKTDKIIANNPIKKVAKTLFISACRVIGGGCFVRKIIKESQKCKQKSPKYMGARVWCIWGERGIIPAEAFCDTVDIEFEGHMFPAPIGYDIYLTCLYGDYLPEPPEEKRKTHHQFNAYRI